MSDLKVCRICLRTEAKMYHFDRYQLKFYYEEIMALRVNKDDGLPHYFCYECATILHKFHKFKEKCYSGQKALKEMLWRGAITYESIYKIHRNDTMLKSQLETMTVSDRIKTYTARDSREISESIDDDEMNIDKIEINIEELGYTDDDKVSTEYMPVHDEKNINDGKNVNVVDEKVAINIENINIMTCDQENVIIDVGKIHCNEIMMDEEKKEITDKETVEDKLEINASPKTVYIDIENRVIDTKNEEIKERKKKKLYTGLRVHRLDEKYWRQFDLSEKEALEEFRARAEDKKYIEAAFKCTDCFKGFSKDDMLRRHKLLRHAESLGQYECRFCHMRYKLDCYLRKHMKQHYAKYECLRCHLVCQLEHTALLHEEYHSGVTRKCIYCNEEFRHMSTYYTHLRTHRSEHVCTLCGASFVSDVGLRQHKNIKHIIADIDSPDDDEEVNSHCDRCDITFDTRRAYEEHLFHSALHCSDKSEKSVAKSCRKILGKKEQAKITKGIRKRNNDDNDKFKPINGRKGMKGHRRKKTKPTTCNQCGKHFATQAACWKHHTAEHPRTSFYSATDRYICEICGSSLAPGSVASHQNMHTREKVHTCDTCGRQFHAIIGLKRHLVTHTGEKPYACPLCDKRFTQSNSMKLHYRTFHLKQPYPKRNRRKKPDKPKESADGSDSDSESDESLPDAEPLLPERDPGLEPVAVSDRPTDENLHYLTLT